VCLCHQAV